VTVKCILTKILVACKMPKPALQKKTPSPNSKLLESCVRKSTCKILSTTKSKSLHSSIKTRFLAYALSRPKQSELVHDHLQLTLPRKDGKMRELVRIHNAIGILMYKDAGQCPSQSNRKERHGCQSSCLDGNCSFKKMYSEHAEKPNRNLAVNNEHSLSKAHPADQDSPRPQTILSQHSCLLGILRYANSDLNSGLHGSDLFWPPGTTGLYLPGRTSKYSVVSKKQHENRVAISPPSSRSDMVPKQSRITEKKSNVLH